MVISILKSLLANLGIDVHRIRPPQPNEFQDIPDSDLYTPLFSPWLGLKDFRHYYDIAAPRTLVSPDRCYVLHTLVRQAIRLEGNIWECGVYKGGTAAMMAAMLREFAPSKRLFLFDTFEGMPETDGEKDWHKKGDFSDTSLESVTQYVGNPDLCVIRKGFIPDTFVDLDAEKIALAHIDVDIYKSIVDSLDFIWHRLAPGGFIVFDDYGFPSCPGARKAVDEFFSQKSSVPLCLPTGQAVIFKSVV